jgi:uncharacterized lipoprotein YddW (UPF0748 family)
VSQRGAEKVAEQLRRRHINRVHFLVKGYSGEVCYPSKLAPVLPGGNDTLKEFLEACHKRNIELHAWLMFNADTQWGRLHPGDAMCREEIDLAIKDVREIVKHKKHSLVLSAAFMPEGGEMDDTFALCHYAQSYTTAGAQLDYTLPMTYSKDPQWTALITRNAQSKSHRPAYSGVWASERPALYGELESDGLSVNNSQGSASTPGLEANIETLREEGVKGFVLSQYNTISERMWSRLP